MLKEELHQSDFTKFYQIMRILLKYHAYGDASSQYKYLIWLFMTILKGYIKRTITKLRLSLPL